MADDAVRACFVLSAGRTGSVALAKRLSQLLPGALVLHEPSPARIELLVGNLRNDTGLGRSLARSIFLETRRRRLSRLPNGCGYVEINPLLCPLVDLLPQLSIPFNVVHMVRRPSAWAQSITAFGASVRFRAIIDYVPFAKPYPNPRPAGWRRMPEAERALWRWRACNERILSLRSNCAAYGLIRYEDLFSRDPQTSTDAFSQLMRLMPGGSAGAACSLNMLERHNPAPQVSIPEPAPELVRTICGDLAGRLGYEIG